MAWSFGITTLIVITIAGLSFMDKEVPELLGMIVFTLLGGTYSAFQPRTPTPPNQESIRNQPLNVLANQPEEE